jgi:transposase
MLRVQVADREIIYVDETTVHLWSYRRKIWMPSDNPIKVILPADRGHSVTVVGAISNKRDDMVYMLTKSTNKEDTARFLALLRSKWPSAWDASLVWDNHPAHTSNMVQAFLEEQSFSTIKMPPCSSPLNPIERVWGTMKHYWIKHVNKQVGFIKSDDLSDNLTKVIEEHIQGKCGNFWKSNLTDC